MSTEAETAEEKKTREEAQARRQRILDGAGSRMDVVEGVAAPAEASAGGSKLAAMRRRRFKKKAETTAPKEEAPPVVEPVATTTATPEEEAPSTINNNNTEDAASKKKYMGVARMRRMKLKEKQQQAEEADSMDTFVAKKRTTAPRYPILMHIVTVLLLFVAGLDIGLQQAGIDYLHTDQKTLVMNVHTELAPRRLGGISFLLSKVSNEEVFVRGGDLKAQLLNEGVDAPTAEDSDEFDVTASDTEKEGIIDPLFGADLDKLTNGPGPIMWAARQAVKFHRMLLRIFYYGPSQLVLWLLSCSTNPPIFAVVAIILRQLVGNVILGAKLQDVKEDEEQQKDIMSMVKAFVTKFVFAAFPTLVSLYDAWVHLRADMYVVLCGFFIGLAVSHTPMIQDGTLLEGVWNKPSSDEL